MFELNAKHFYISVDILARIERVTSGLDNSVLKPDSKARPRRHLNDLIMHCDILGAKVTKMVIEDFLESLERDDFTFEQFAEHCRRIKSTLRNELSTVNVLVLDSSKTKYYKYGIPLFGMEVNDRFPSATDDLIDVGRCIAFNNGTSAVFHLMRVMEAGLKALAKSLNIPYAPSWESYIRQINAKIEAKHKAKPRGWKKDESFYRDIAGDLTTIKIAWRNPTMHIVKRYNVDDAEIIFNAVKEFMMRLATCFDENGKRVSSK